jgi:hypothetical protein
MSYSESKKLDNTVSMVVMHMSAVAAVINMMIIGPSNAWTNVVYITRPRNDMAFSMLTRETMTGGSAKGKMWEVSLCTLIE